MSLYVNGFSCAIDNEDELLYLDLLNYKPDFDDDDNDSGIKEVAGSFVIDKTVALKFAHSIIDNYKNNDEFRKNMLAENLDEQ